MPPTKYTDTTTECEVADNDTGKGLDAPVIFSKKAVANIPLSPFAQFSAAFRGYSFFDIYEHKLLSKTQVYFKDPILAMSMALTGDIISRYKLVDTPGWTDGILNS